jgi:hypothetical protein
MNELGDLGCLLGFWGKKRGAWVLVQCDEEENKKLGDLGCVLVALEDRMEEHGVTWASCWEVSVWPQYHQ